VLVVQHAVEARVVKRLTVASLAALALAAVTGCGNGADDDPRASWDGAPAVAPHPEIPTDRIATGRIRNEGADELRLSVADARALDVHGTPVRATIRFAAGVTHSLYPPRDAPHENPRQQQERLGDAATIEPGQSAPLTVAWHAGTRDRVPVRVDLGPVDVPLPSAP
jgi:hypothetical protein